MARTTRSRVPRRAAKSPASHLTRRLATFITERFPAALDTVLSSVGGMLDLPADTDDSSRAIDALRPAVGRALGGSLTKKPPRGLHDLPETTPGVDAARRWEQFRNEVVDAVDGFLERESIRASFTDDERLEMLRGMVLTRAVDNQLKSFFLGGQVRYGGAAFQGKGFRSLGQEAIYAAPLRLRRGADHRSDDGGWLGDVVAPLIRDLGAALAMRPDAENVGMVLNAQMGKAGPPMNGKDFHVGNLDWGILPAAAPLSISTLTVAGLAMAFHLRGEERVAVSFIGEGGSSLGEWHEAINLCAARQLPAIFCLQNNQTALSTPVSNQSAVRVFADKAQGYGVPGLTIDGTDPEAIAAAFAWAAARARAGRGPTLIEVVAMRMCGHAHHDDMLYIGHEPQTSWDYPTLSGQGYADREAYDYWSRRDPIATYSTRLQEAGVIEVGTLAGLREEAERTVAAETQRIMDAPWPDADQAGLGVFADAPPARHVEHLEHPEPGGSSGLPPVEEAPAFDPKGRTYLEAIQLGVADALRQNPGVFVYGQDVGGQYGNAFLLLRPLLDEYADRILNSTLAEGGIIGVCVGAALMGMRPIGEIQFNDFVATGFNQLVNNAAKTRYRWGGSVPMVLRMPYGGLRRAGPYHSQNTESWFYRTPGLKIVAPSTPHDARALMAAAVADPDPVLYYEHIGLYRDPKIRQALPVKAPEPLPLGRAALRRAGDDLAIVSYGAYVHLALRVAETLARDGIEAAVLDLRSLVPLDREALLAVARHCGKVLIAQEDSRTGGIGESLAAILQEQAFESLDAPIRVVGALDAPVPYSPPLEDAFLAGEARVERAARLLAAY